MARTLSEVDNALKSIETRVNQLDGYGLNDPIRSTVNTLMKEINGLRTTVEQVVLGMETDRQNLEKRVEALETSIQLYLGVS